MSTHTRLPKKIKTSTTSQTLLAWEKIRGLLAGRGPKDVVAWQRRGRKDRKIIK